MFINTVLYIRRSRPHFQQLNKMSTHTNKNKTTKKQQSHLQELNQSYLEHMKNAFSYSMLSFKSGVVFFIHGCFPNVLVDNGSKWIKKLHEQLTTKPNNRK
jgi:hypothetical protein